MDWIKKNYDRLLLGVFGLLALIIGGCQSIKAFSSATVEPPARVKDDRYNPGEYKTQQATDAQKAIGVEIKWNPVSISEHEKGRLFTAIPVVETGDTPPFPLLKPESKQIHAPIPNWWLYENDIDVTLSNVKESDPDGDLFANLEEFNGNSNPRDPSSKPKITMKLIYVGPVEDKYEIRFSNKVGNELQIRREVPLLPNGRKPSGLQFKVGDVIFEDDRRFKILAVQSKPVANASGVVAQVEHLVLEDTTKPGSKPLEIPVRTTLNVPSYRAKVKSAISGEEVVVKEGEDINLKDFPGIKFRLKKILPDSIEVEFVEPGKTEATDKIPLSNAVPSAPAPSPDAAAPGTATPPTAPPSATPPAAPTTAPPPATQPATPPTAPPAPPSTPPPVR